MKLHGGTHHVQGSLNRGTRPQPSPNHGGTNLPKGVVRTLQKRLYSVHGGTHLQMGVLNKKK